MSLIPSNIVYAYLDARGLKMDSQEFDHACDLVDFAFGKLNNKEAPGAVAEDLAAPQSDAVRV